MSHHYHMIRLLPSHVRWKCAAPRRDPTRRSIKTERLVFVLPSPITIEKKWEEERKKWEEERDASSWRDEGSIPYE